MANSCYNHLVLSGPEHAVRAADADAASDANPLSAEVRIDRAVDAFDGLAHADFTFATNWHGPLSEAGQLSRRHPGVVVTLASVELGNGNASASVWKDGDLLGEYDMPVDELSEVAGEGADECAVVDSLLATVAAYGQDAIEVGGRSPA
jgi:hypothetical protein